MNWYKFVENVQKWAQERNLINGSHVRAQAAKGLSELGELADNVSKGNMDKVMDDIGDNCVVAVIVDSINRAPISEPIYHGDGSETNKFDCLSDMAFEWSYYLGPNAETSAPCSIPYYAKILACNQKLNFEECLEQAWNDIKDRKGIMHNGVFVKSTDPRYEEICAIYAPQ